MKKLVLPSNIVEQIIGHCLQGRPNEACGIIAADGSGQVVKAFLMNNADQSPVRYSIEPKEQFAAYRLIDTEGWELAGVFHSHTRTEAYPSPTDVREAREDVPYIIVSLAAETPIVRAFRIVKENWTDAEGVIEEVPVVVEAKEEH